MRRLRLAQIGVLIVAASMLAACSTASPGLTHEPPPSATPTPVPSASASDVPATASASPAGNVVRIVAKNIAYDVNHIEVPSGQPFTIQFDNQDAGIPHNVGIKELFSGEIFTGVGSRQYHVQALPKGDYTFSCNVHPNMTGTLTAL